MSKSYLTPVELYVDLHLDPVTESATITSDIGSWTFRAGRMVEFKGLPEYVYLIQAVHPTGLTVINAASSKPMYLSWDKLFGKFAARTKSIWLDAVLNNGWMEVY